MSDPDLGSLCDPCQSVAGFGACLARLGQLLSIPKRLFHFRNVIPTLKTYTQNCLETEKQSCMKQRNGIAGQSGAAE